MTGPNDKNQDIEEEEYMFKSYHNKLLSLTSSRGLATSSSERNNNESSGHKRYDKCDKITLPNGNKGGNEFITKIHKRASYKDPNKENPINVQEIATLTYFSYGEIQEKTRGLRRPVPSAGAQYPLELYPIVVNSTDIAEGLYHYNVENHELECLQRRSYREWIVDNWALIDETDTVSAIIIITACPERSATKYDEWGYLFSGIEAGAVIQNLQLIAQELDKGSRPHNGLNYQKLRNELALDSSEYIISSVVLAGTKRKL